MADFDLFSGEGLNVAGGFGNADLTNFDFDLNASAANFTAINETPVSTSTRTVSPKDLFNDSAPPSTAFTNLTSPDINTSPLGTDSYQTSPAFTTEGDFLAGGHDSWYSLFPDTSNEAMSSLAAPQIERTGSDTSINTPSSGASPGVANAGAQRRSLPETPNARHSSISGVKPRRRKGPLVDIKLDPADKVAYKRARNTLAARDSRQRKLEHVTILEGRVSELEDEIAKWRAQALAHGLGEPQ